LPDPQPVEVIPHRIAEGLVRAVPAVARGSGGSA
jgi:hypothetical protein